MEEKRKSREESMDKTKYKKARNNTKVELQKCGQAEQGIQQGSVGVR